MFKPKMTMAEAGRLGGKETMRLYGREYFARLGHIGGLVGGRPRLLTYDELMERKALENMNKGGVAKTTEGNPQIKNEAGVLSAPQPRKE